MPSPCHRQPTNDVRKMFFKYFMQQVSRLNSPSLVLKRNENEQKDKTVSQSQNEYEIKTKGL